MNGFYSEKALQKMGFKYLGKNVLISEKASIYGAENISIGDNSRIDDFCILNGTIEIGKYVHIAAYCGLFAGDAGISLADYAGLSSRISVYAASDDYSGEYMTNPTVALEFRKVTKRKVVFGKHCIVGTGSTILPGVAIGDGCSIGSMSLVNKSTDPWGIYVGIPAKRMRDRSKELLKLETAFENRSASAL